MKDWQQALVEATVIFDTKTDTSFLVINGKVCSREAIAPPNAIHRAIAFSCLCSGTIFRLFLKQTELNLPSCFSDFEVEAALQKQIDEAPGWLEEGRELRSLSEIKMPEWTIAMHQVRQA